MRPAIFALLLCVSPAAFGQSPSPAPLKPALPPLAPTLPPQAPILEFNQRPKEFSWNGVVPRSTIVLPPTPLQFKDRAQIDPQMIVRPPQSSLGLETPGTQIAQNLYPGLQLLPIGVPTGKLEPIPTTWPGLKLEQIPTDVSNAQITIIEKTTTLEPLKK